MNNAIYYYTCINRRTSDPVRLIVYKSHVPSSIAYNIMFARYFIVLVALLVGVN